VSAALLDGVGRAGSRLGRSQELPGCRDAVDKRACVFHGTVTVVSIRLWLRS
jgi:hypothetical protein